MVSNNNAGVVDLAIEYDGFPCQLYSIRDGADHHIVIAKSESDALRLLAYSDLELSDDAVIIKIPHDEVVGVYDESGYTCDQTAFWWATSTPRSVLASST